MTENKRMFAKGKYSEMLNWVIRGARMHSGKAVFAVLVFVLIQMFLNAFCMVPILMGIKSAMGLETAFSLVLVLAANVVVSMMLYGLNVIMARLVTNSYVTLGFLFIGFKQNRKKVFLQALLYTVINVVVISLIGGCSVFVYFKFYPEMKIDEFIVMVYGVVSMLSSILLLAFIFSFLFLYDNPDMSPAKSFVMSAKLFFTQMFHFIGFEIYTGGWAFMSWIVLDFLNLLLGTSNASLSRVLSFCAFMFQINAVVKMFLALPVYFYYSVHKSIASSEDNAVAVEPYDVEENTEDSEESSDDDSESGRRIDIVVDEDSDDGDL